MGMRNKKKLYRLPAFFLAMMLLFTSIPFSSISYAAGTQEKEGEVIPEEQTAGAVSENETEEMNEETKKEGTSDSGNITSKEFDESNPDIEEIEEDIILSENAGESKTTYSLKIKNGYVGSSSSDAISVSENGVEKIYIYPANTYVRVEREEEGFFEGWYNQKGECVSKNTYYYFTITEDTELTAKWNTSIVKNTLEGASYYFDNYTGSYWTLEEGDILKSGQATINSSSSLAMYVTIPEGGGLLQFDYSTSSEEDFDEFYFSVDEEWKYKIIESGKTDYKTYAVNLSEGSHVVFYQYYKDDTNSQYDDCAYVKNISIEPIKDTRFTVSVLSGDEEKGQVGGGGSYQYGEEVILTAEPKEGYLFNGWKDSTGNIISYDQSETIVVLKNETYQAEFISESDYKAACEKMIEGNDKLITVSEVQGKLLELENGAFIRHKNTKEEVYDSVLNFQVTGEFEGTKYLTFELYDPKRKLSIYADWITEEDSPDSIWFNGNGAVQNCSIKLYKNSTIEINISNYNYISRNAYVKNLKIVDEKEEVKVSAVSGDDSLGTVTGGGNVTCGTSLKLKAIPKEGCEFTCWKDAQGNIVSYERIFTVEAAKDAVYTAVFRNIEVKKESLSSILKDDSGIIKKVYMRGGEWTFDNKNRLCSPHVNNGNAIIDIVVEVPEGKCYQISGKGNYDYIWGGQFICTLDDKENDCLGYFQTSDWDDSTMESGMPILLTSGTHTVHFVFGCGGEINAEMARIMEIAFLEIAGTATIDGDCIEYISSKTLEGSIEGLGTYEIGKNVTLKAPSIDGYFFYGWHGLVTNYYDDYFSIHPETTIQATQDAQYTAYYKAMPKNFVDSSFTLLPEGNWEFDGKKASTGNGELTVGFTVSENDTKILCFDVTSKYSSDKASFYVDGEFYGEYGEITANGQSGIVPVSSGNHTVTWIVDKKADWEAVSISNISFIDEEELREQKFTLSVNPNHSDCTGNISGTGDYSYQTVTTLKATEENGYHFIGWIAPDGTFSKEPEIQVTMDRSKIYKAYFTNESNTDNYSKAVVADSKYAIRFDHSLWHSNEYEYGINLDNNSYLPYDSLNAVITVPQGEEDMLSFDYDMDCYDIYNDSNTEGYLTVCVNGEEKLRIPYDPEEGNTMYQLPLSAGENNIQWKFVLTNGSQDDYWDVKVSDIDVKNIKYYTIKAIANNASFGTVTGGGQYLWNQTAVLKAIPNKGYVFKAWQMNGTEVSTEPEYSIFVAGNTEYTAVFEIDSTYKPDEEKKEEPDKDKDKDKDTHTHKAGEWIIIKEATAKTTGLRVKKCTICGKEMEQEVLPKYKVSFNVKGTIPLQLKKSTTAIKAVLMDGDKVKSYKSSNTKVATVSKSGKITAKKTGKAKITVTTRKGATATVTIKVQKAPVKTTKISVDKTKLTLAKGKSYTLSVTKAPVTSLDKITFKTSDKKVATVNRKGKITAKKKGKATITVECGKKKKTVKVTVK